MGNTGFTQLRNDRLVSEIRFIFEGGEYFEIDPKMPPGQPGRVVAGPFETFEALERHVTTKLWYENRDKVYDILAEWVRSYVVTSEDYTVDEAIIEGVAHLMARGIQPLLTVNRLQNILMGVDPMDTCTTVDHAIEWVIHVVSQSTEDVEAIAVRLASYFRGRDLLIGEQTMGKIAEEQHWDLDDDES